MSFPALELIEERFIIREAAFPYITGYLSFREGPAVLDALDRLSIRADIVIFDGQGIAHPRGAGIAAFMGALLDTPSIGAAKTRLVGEFTMPGPERGSRSPLIHNGSVVGAVVRTRADVKPLFVSPGHRIDIDGAIRIVLACALSYRLAEPVRLADMLARRVKKRLF